MSRIVKVAVVVDVFPQASVALNVTRADPVPPHPSDKPAKSLLQVTPLQSSVAVAPPLLASHALSAAVFPLPSQSTVWSDAGVIDGGVMSRIVKVAVVLELLLHASVAVKITVADPVAPHPSLRPV